jgi:hypothetical protein
MGSMSGECDTINHLSRWGVATRVVWTFIKEAENIQVEGRSHYVGIYLFNGRLHYPIGCSEFPTQWPLHPLPSCNVASVKRDFLRYWPETEPSGSTEWSYALPAMVDDYITFGAGDVILICDGDMHGDMANLWEGDSADDLTAAKYVVPTLSRDARNPTHLMKLQRFMVDNECGAAYMFWIVPRVERPLLQCPRCRRIDNYARFVRLDRSAKRIMMRCSRNHDFGVDPVSGCERKDTCELLKHGDFGWGNACGSCKYLYLVLGEMFEGGNNIFSGQTVDDLRSAAIKTMTEHHDRMLYGKKKTVRRGVGGAPIEEIVRLEEEDDD